MAYDTCNELVLGVYKPTNTAWVAAVRNDVGIWLAAESDIWDIHQTNLYLAGTYQHLYMYIVHCTCICIYICIYTSIEYTYMYTHMYVQWYTMNKHVCVCANLYVYMVMYAYVEKCEYCMSSMFTSSVHQIRFSHLKGCGKPCQRLLPLALMSRCVDCLRSRCGQFNEP